jgi:hypothetical protein
MLLQEADVANSLLSVLFLIVAATFGGVLYALMERFQLGRKFSRFWLVLMVAATGVLLAVLWWLFRQICMI